MEAAWRTAAGVSRVLLALSVALLPLLMVPPPTAAAQDVESSGIAPAVAASEKLVQRAGPELLRMEAEIGSGANPQVEKRLAAEEAAARSRAEFLDKYDQFARRVMDLLQEMRDKPGVVPLSRLREVQKAWAAWQKCKEWPAAKQ